MSDLTKVQDILKGSKRINEMKEEIKSFVSIIGGFLKRVEFLEEIRRIKQKEKIKYSDNSIALTHGFTSERNLLFIVGVDGYDLVVRYDTELTVTAYPKNNLDAYFLSEEVPLNHAMGVHRSLPELLNGFIEKFPNLEQKIQPLLDAAKI